MISEQDYNLTPEPATPECEFCCHSTIGEVYETSFAPNTTTLELCESCIREAILDGEELTTTLEL